MGVRSEIYCWANLVPAFAPVHYRLTSAFHCVQRLRCIEQFYFQTPFFLLMGSKHIYLYVTNAKKRYYLYILFFPVNCGLSGLLHFSFTFSYLLAPNAWPENSANREKINLKQGTPGRCPMDPMHNLHSLISFFISFLLRFTLFSILSLSPSLIS